MSRSYAERQEAGRRLAALSQQPTHVIAIQRKLDASQQPIRILDYGVMTVAKARSLIQKLDRPGMSPTHMTEEMLQRGMDCEKGYKSWGVPIVKVEKYDPVTGLPLEAAVKRENFKSELKTNQHGFTELEAYWPSKPSWREYGEGRAHMKATLQRDGSIWLVLSEVPDDCKGTREVMVTLPFEVVTDLIELTKSKRP